MTDVSNRKREPNGIPTAGRFTFEQVDPADVTLTAPKAVNLEETIDPEELVKFAGQRSVVWDYRYGLRNRSTAIDSDDIAQEAMTQLLEALHAGKDIKDTRRWVSSAAANLTVRATSNHFRGEDRKAYFIVRKQVSELEQDLGRELTRSEVDAIAERVREDWHDKRHRPSAAFMQTMSTYASLDKSFGEDGEGTLGEQLVDSADRNYVEPGSYMDRALSYVEDENVKNLPGSRARAQRLTYNAVAELSGAPLVAEGSLTPRKVQSLSRVMKSHPGGVRQACKDWSEGDDNEAVKAMFAPFGRLDFDDREVVVSLLERFKGDQIDIVWHAALSHANDRFAEAG